MAHQVTCDFAGRQLTLETGTLALQADAAVLAKYGDTMVLVTVCVSKEPTTLPFLPLRVDFEEKMYAVGRIPGGFFKREGKPSDEAVIMGRSVDRPLRPLIPASLRHEVQVIVNPLSVEADASVSLVSMIAGSAAVHLSSVPFHGPFGAALIGRRDGELVVNPTFEELGSGGLKLLVAATREGIVEIEMEGNQVPEEHLCQGLQMAYDAAQPVIACIEELRALAGKPKGDYVMWEPDPAVVEHIRSQFGDRIRKTVEMANKQERNAQVQAIAQEITASLPEELQAKTEDRDYVIEQIQKERLQQIVLEEGRRADGRSFSELRPITCQVGLLPRVHGSGLFNRGDTQVLTATTLGAWRDQRLVRSLDEEEYTRFMHHYNFPPFATGEVRALRAPARREVGHGALAGKAIEYVLPDEAEFPYTIRCVSEVLGGDASTSMASVCASTLSLMDAGVPIKAPVAGISVGLVYKDRDNYQTFTDIQAMEDFLAHMDFKVAGTRAGVNAIQVDTKITALPLEVCFEALERAREARLQILDIMTQTIPQPRAELSAYAPRMYSLNIPVDKIGMLIGPGGKTVRKLQDDYDVQIDIEDNGTVLVYGTDPEKTQAARQAIADMTRDVVVGEVFTGRVVSTTPFGAFVELMPGREGLLHISHLAWEHVAKTEDVVKAGDMVEVKVIEVDDEGKVRLSRKELLPRPDRSGGGRGSGGSAPRGGGAPRGGRPGGSGRGLDRLDEYEPGRGKAYFREKKK